MPNLPTSRPPSRRKPGRGPPSPANGLPPGPPRQREVLALRIARELADAGKPVSRRALRSHGVKGSNEGLSALARQLNAQEPTTGPDSAAVRPVGDGRAC
jgi:hypothetical protein